jgi:protein TonB
MIRSCFLLVFLGVSSFTFAQSTADTLSEIIEIEEEIVEEEPIFTIVEQMPRYPGGEAEMYKYLGQITYPEVAKDAGIQGKVFARFVVAKSGKIEDVKIIRGLHSSLDSVVVHHLRAMPVWEPGTQRGKPVRVSYTLPVNFTLK